MSQQRLPTLTLMHGGEIPETLVFDYEWRLLWSERVGVHRPAKKTWRSWFGQSILTPWWLMLCYFFLSSSTGVTLTPT